MKFTQKEACEKLTALLTNNGKKPLRMSAKTLESHVETLMTLLNDDEMELDDFVEKIKPMLESTNSNVEHDVSKGIKDYEDKNPYKKSENQKQDDPDPDDEVSMLKKQVQTLLDEKEERSKSAKVASIRAEIKKYLEDNNVKESEWIEDQLGIIEISEGTVAETAGERLLNLYNKYKANHDLTPPHLPGPDHKDNKEGLFDDLVEMTKSRESYQ